MKTFIYSTDLREGCLKALNITQLFASKHNNSRVILVHAFAEHLAADEEKKLHTMQTVLMEAGIACETVAKQGDIVELVEFCSDKFKASLLIAGMSNCGPLAENTIGSVAARLLQEVTVPVLLVPANLDHPGQFKHVTYATDYHLSDGSMVEQLANLLKPFKPQINLLHVYVHNESPEQELSDMDNFRKDITKQVNYNDLSFQITHGSDVLEKLSEHLESEAADLLVLATHHGHLFDRMFHTSIGRELTVESSVPILAFHYRRHFKPILL